MHNNTPEVTTLRGPVVIVDPVTGAKLFEFGIRQPAPEAAAHAQRLGLADDSERLPFFAIYHPGTGRRVLEAGPVEDHSGSFIDLYTEDGELGAQVQVLQHGGHVGLFQPGETEPEVRAALEVTGGHGSVSVIDARGACARLKLGD